MPFLVHPAPCRAPVTSVPVGNTAPLSEAPCPIDRRARLSRREFEHEYNRPRRPVVLTDATAAWGARAWTPEVLRDRVGHRMLTFRDGGPPVEFGELCTRIMASTAECPAPYARNVHITRDLPELAEDIRPRLLYCQPDWKSSRLLPKHFGFENGLEEMFFGGAGAKFPRLHIDYWGMDAYLSQLFGTKEVLLFAPDQTPYLYPDPASPLISTVDNFDEPDFERFPLLRQAQPLRFVLRPGETLFCPNGWWHTTAMHEVSITVVTANWGRANWPALIEDYVRTNAPARPRKTRLVAAYLQAAGLALGLRDRLTLGL